MKRRAFLLGSTALVYGCGGGSGGSAASTTGGSGSNAAPSPAPMPIAASGCARGSVSTVWTSQGGGGDAFSASGAIGHYFLRMNNWNWSNIVNPASQTVTMWWNGPACWGFDTTETADSGNVGGYPGVIRGWTNDSGIMTALGRGNGASWTQSSGMGIQVFALTKCHVAWSIAAPTVYGSSRYDALLDVYFHAIPNPSGSDTKLAFAIDIYQVTLDGGGNYYQNSVLGGGSYFLKTIGGVQYAGIYDDPAFNASDGATSSCVLFCRPTSATDSAHNPNLWGKMSAVHDLGAIIAWLNQTSPLDDSGTPIKHYGTGATVTSPPIASSIYLTSINAGFEVQFAGTANPFTTEQFWVAVQNEADGPAALQGNPVAIEDRPLASCARPA
jgi:hypothetical protein